MPYGAVCCSSSSFLPKNFGDTKSVPSDKLSLLHAHVTASRSWTGGTGKRSFTYTRERGGGVRNGVTKGLSVMELRWGETESDPSRDFCSSAGTAPGTSGWLVQLQCAKGEMGRLRGGCHRR
ncbi:hypothetical protein JDV02_010829 [Purpureocillium takamizusanense]|uniref:Uncharacterized protein n=1 Tax=Purpureocillium takamizusanense TaxID=2060973 RepID=A0A9Q8Q504_9HYPO|nr:uncharacterized protein JDV02_010829 [Purpureocillium takamizusanense]UNI13809.1 hypothetical protein JDV02_010829 [Purpureocillium takamizusanense]